MRKINWVVIPTTILVLTFLGQYWWRFVIEINKSEPKKVIENITLSPTPVASVSATPTASPSPTVRVLSFSEMNELYGPCVRLPILMYHHINSLEIAKEGGYGSLTIEPERFKSQMEYLKTKGYNFVTPRELTNFFTNGGGLPAKPVMITFDDGYMDNYSAFEILRSVGGKGVIFLATGLMENPNYLTWSKISEMSGSGVITFGNHTWSHRNVGGNKEAVKKEILMADGQLKERGLNQDKIFAYPYGIENGFTENFLASEGYTMALTTVHGTTQCAKKRFELPRIRVGNTGLSAYGL